MEENNLKGFGVRSSVYELSCLSTDAWDPRPQLHGFVLEDQSKRYKVPPATYKHSQLRDQMVYCEELDSLLYHSNGRILSFHTKTQQVSEFWEDSAQAMACRYGYFVYAYSDISIMKISTKDIQKCNISMSVNSIHIEKEGDKLFVIATYNGGHFNIVEVIEQENNHFALNMKSCTVSNFNYNIISRGDGQYSDLYTCGRDGQKTVLILKPSKGSTPQGFDIHSEYLISHHSSSITTKWLPNSSQILTGTESGISILSDYELKKELWKLPLDLPNQPASDYNSARIIKSGHPYIPITAISYSKAMVRLLYLAENLIENIFFVDDKDAQINGLEFVRNRLYVMVGSFLYSFALDNRSYLAASWPASHVQLPEDHLQTIKETCLVLKQYSTPPELIQLIIRRILLQWPVKYF